MSEPLSVLAFLQKFWPNVGALMSGALCVPLTFASVYFNNAPLKFMFGCLAALSVVWACYKVWRDSVSTLQMTIADRDAEIEKLKHRPYDDEHLRLAQLKVDALPDESKDLIYFLLHHGEMDTEELRRHCQNPTYFDGAIQQARGEDVVRVAARQIVGRAGVQSLWNVNSEFKTVLQDLLGKREARYFL